VRNKCAPYGALAIIALDNADIALTCGLAQGFGGLVVGRVVAVGRGLQVGEFDHHSAGADLAFDHSLSAGADEEFGTEAFERGCVCDAVFFISSGVGNGDMGDPIGFGHGSLS
jgi:hypothetical protein